MSNQPPKWIDRFLEWYCRKDKLEDLQGDLYEHFHRNSTEKGEKWARWIYFIDVLKFFRIYTIRKLKIRGPMNSFQLLGNYWKTSIRSLARNKLFSAINVAGLAISMSVCILMIVMISELLSFDTFHEKYDRIYRIVSTYSDSKEDPFDLASVSAVTAKKMMSSHSAIEDVALLRRSFDGDFQYHEKIIALEGHWSNNAIFNVLTFEILSGDLSNALSEPYTIVLTESAATKLFGSENPIGKVLRRNGEKDYTITALIKDPPRNSHIDFDVLGSFATYETWNREEAKESGVIASVDKWTSIWMYHAYVLLKNPDNLDEVQQFLDEISEKENKAEEYISVTNRLQPLSEIIPGPDLSNNIGASMDIKIIWILLFLTGIVILSACFNYTNLSIARSLRRAKEVGVRKVVGATKSQVFTQFILEAIILSAIATILSLGLFVIIKPQFLMLVENGEMPISLIFKSWYLFPIIGFALFVGFISGFLPSLFLSKIEALKALKDASKINLFKGVNLRLLLIVFQFTLSIGFIIASTIAYKQYKYALNFDLGYETNNILNIEKQGNDSQLLANEFSKIAGVEKVSRSAAVMSTGTIYGDYLKYEDPLDSIMIILNYVDEGYLSLHGFELIAGRDFSTLPENSEAGYVIVNEQTLKRFQIGSAEEAIGKTVKMEYEGKQEIIGVVRDFHYSKIDDPIEPFLFVQNTDQTYFINLKLDSKDMIALITRLEETWKSIDSLHPFEAEFFNKKIESAYEEYEMIFKIVGFLSFLSISIAALGLLGMAVYTAESRIKEISIRKVLGASESNLIYLLSKGFLVMILIASVVAIIVTYFIFENIVLADTANRVSIGFLDFSIGVIITLLIGMLTIGWQTNKAVKTNPATTLRDE